MRVLAALLLASSLFASAKSEAALRAQLAEAQAQIAKLSADNAQRERQLSVANAERGRQAASSSRAVRNAQNENAGKAQAAVSDAQDAVVDAQNANSTAVAAVGAAKTQGNTILVAVVGTGVTLLFGLLTLIAQQFFKMAAAAQAHRWEVAATAAHRKLELERIGAVQIAVTEKLAPKGPPKRRLALLVDDDPNVAPLVSLALAGCAMTMDTAEDGALALAALRAKTYDLILLDLTLPPGGPSGMDVLAAAKAIQPVPVIILTADNRDETFVRSLNTGALDVIVKPITPDALTLRLRALFD